ncbi:TolC family protein [Sphingomonas aerolata]|uniref:TolC family protein n=1 Tax=Sphingomonas aerolata TaxID=185951 RepID=UPI002FE2B7EE
MASAGIRAAEVQRRVAALRPNPSIIAEAENVVGTGIYQGLRSSETTLGLALPLETWRQAQRQDRASLMRRSVVLVFQADIARADLHLRVTQTYIVAVAAQRRIGIARDQLSIATDVLRAASVRVQAGRASPLEEQRADVARARRRRVGARRAFGQRRLGNLARLLGIHVERSTRPGSSASMRSASHLLPVPRVR